MLAAYLVDFANLQVLLLFKLFLWRTERSGVSNTNLRALVGGRVVFNTRANFVSVAILGAKTFVRVHF